MFVRRLFHTFFLLLLLTLAGCSEKPTASAIASAHPLATESGHTVMARGGNAFDAAIAVTATLAVVEPYGSGIGGGGFYLLHRARDGKQVMLDARERAPLAAHRDMYLDQAGEVIPGASVNGALAAAIPGIPAALARLAEQYGNLPLADSLAPAIEIARNGFKVDEHYRKYAGFRLAQLQGDEEAARIFLSWNSVPPLGMLLKQPDLANTLGAIANNGRAGFYEGIVAKQLVEGVQAGGGIWTLEDLQQYTVVERQPVVGHYKGARIVSVPPPSSGGVAILTMLNILGNDDLQVLSGIQRKHLIIEAMRRAYRDRAEYLGDTDYVQVPMSRLISKEHGRQLRTSIKPDEATPSYTLQQAAATNGAGNNTTHFSILDKQGNRVAATLSVNYPFGACFVPAGTGVLLNDEMDDFSAKPGVPNVYGLVGNEANAIAPGKRPLSSMSPTFIENERGVAIIGTPGGSRIISMVMLAALEYLQGGSAESMVERPRFHHQYLPDLIIREAAAFSEEEEAELQLMGHIFRPLDRRGTYGEQASRYGNMQVVVWDKKKKHVEAASDTRGIGAARVQ